MSLLSLLTEGEPLAPPRHVCRLAAQPDMPKKFSAKLAAQSARDRIPAGKRKPEEPERIKRVLARHVEGNRMLARMPQHLSIGPIALGCDFGGSELAVVFEDSRKKDGPIAHLGTGSCQRIR